MCLDPPHARPALVRKPRSATLQPWTTTTVAVMNPYMSMLIRPFIEVLRYLASSLPSHSPSDPTLWTLVILSPSKSSENEGGNACSRSRTCLWLNVRSRFGATRPLRSSSSFTASGHSPPSPTSIFHSIKFGSNFETVHVSGLVPLIPTRGSDLLKNVLRTPASDTPGTRVFW